MDQSEVVKKLRSMVTSQLGVRISQPLHARLKRFVTRNQAAGLSMATEREVIEAVLRPYLQKHDVEERFAGYEATEEELAA